MAVESYQPTDFAEFKRPPVDTGVTAFHYGSPRAQKARLGRRISPLIRVLIVLIAVLLVLGGGYMLWLGQSAGWFVASFAAWPLAVLIWWKGDLQQVPVKRRGDSIDDVLESKLLAELPKRPTPQDIAAAVMRVNSGQFFAVRFGIGPGFLQQIASADPMETVTLWQAALAIKDEVGSDDISAGIMVAAFVRTYPQMETLLAHLQLETDDVLDGVRWYYHIQDLIAHQKKPKRTGGFARDWSFGYIPYLQRFGRNISMQMAHSGMLTVELEAHQQVMEQLFNTFGSGGRQNITLVGAAGSGKTTLVHAFAERLMDANAKIPSNLKFRQVIMLDPSALISAAPRRGELEGLVTRLLNEAYRAKNVILCLDDAQLFFEEGVGSVDLSNVLLPVLEGGGLRIMLTMDEQRWLQISQRNPSLVNALNRVMVQPATKAETLRVLQDQLLITENQRNVLYMYQSLQEAYRLSERYVHDLAMPGRALRLLESAAGYAEDGLVTARSVQNAIEQTMNVKVGVASTQGDEREKLLNLEEHIHERMINQRRAVNVVSDALRRARSGVRNQNRPIGTFLFLGPTGVGKTELSKALGDVYFGGEDRLVRLDMNEYGSQGDVSRLIADGADDPNSLTAQIMKQPFSVVLLDEIEKAHDSVLATLLQLLDEGILRDIKNREVSFRDAIVIATSNAGADRIRQYIDAGYQLEQFEERFTNELIDMKQFRPEFMNRFDEIVVFRPLTKDELLQIVDLMLQRINKTLEQQKIRVEVAQAGKMRLVEAGYDPRLGARPMQRVVQRSVENIVAKRTLSGETQPGEVVHVSESEIQEALST